MKILIIDDDEPLRMHLSKALKRRGHSAIAISKGDEAMAQLRKEPFDAAVIDMKMMGMNGLQVLKELKKIHPQLIGVILTGYGSISNAVEATKLGAYDYLTKPCEISELEKVLKKGVSETMKAMMPFKEIYHGIVGKSREIKKNDPNN